MPGPRLAVALLLACEIVAIVACRSAVGPPRGPDVSVVALPAPVAAAVPGDASSADAAQSDRDAAAATGPDPAIETYATQVELAWLRLKGVPAAKTDAAAQALLSGAYACLDEADLDAGVASCNRVALVPLARAVRDESVRRRLEPMLLETLSHLRAARTAGAGRAMRQRAAAAERSLRSFFALIEAYEFGMLDLLGVADGGAFP